MLSMKQYWKTVSDIEQTLPDEFVFITSVDKSSLGVTGGATVEASRRGAAEAIARGSHRPASPAEVDQYWKNEEAKRTAYAAAEKVRQENNGGTRVVIMQQPAAAELPVAVKAQTEQTQTDKPAGSAAKR